ncbi:pyridoxal phosphate-dependent aminotransferase [Sedimentibacter hydroxybenzoicus DSM 7310]|uniref:Aminotransferase n=1 Tax=Sedimentibacter hydroxybenzoicus DSM 7310 TaxID=1123245 RepID=A0A974BH14_SEDHY|nr:pyridoxal phosphate-dependent aminotransferase [Sedimentibacter hydroxybenzoicus]NYB73008.1 pyridoxal phosphate-dependent aminotransferase [Sedimentibacter hydroxybenzoicus DSM 7310]
MITGKMISAFQKANGGLFCEVEKADVGDVEIKLKERGVALMAWADPFYPNPSVPQHVAEAMKNSIDSGFASHYTVPIGNGDLKVEISKKLKKINNLDVDAQRNILITPGSDSGLFFAMLPFIENDDEVMIVDPSYPNNFQNTEILGGKIVRIPVYREDGYQFKIEEFEKQLTDKTKMIILTNPNNPTTTVYHREKLMELANFATRNDLIVVVDQAFEQPCFDGREMVSVASLPGMWERTVSVFSISKGMGLSGLRVGYIVADDIIIDKMYATVVSVLGATNTSAQAGAIAALKDDSFMQLYFEIFNNRRKLVYDYLHDIPGVSMLMPESGFLSWIDVSKLGSEDEIVSYLNEDALVAVNSGANYGLQGKGHIRIVQGALDEEKLKESLYRMRNSLIKLSKEKLK